MRKIEIDRIRINENEEYPLYCDLYVLEQIQEKESISQFEREILGAEVQRDENGDPVHDENGRISLAFGQYNIKTMIRGLALMINEGLLIEAEQNGTDPESVSESYLARSWSGSLVELSNALHRAFDRCLVVKKKSKSTTAKTKRNT